MSIYQKLLIGQRLKWSHLLMPHIMRGFHLCDCLAKHMPSVEFDFNRNNENGKKKTEQEREIMCEQIAINLINIFFLFVPNMSTTSSMQNKEEERKKKNKFMHRGTHLYVRLIY